jgi:hypothetical protein
VNICVLPDVVALASRPPQTCEGRTAGTAGTAVPRSIGLMCCYGNGSCRSWVPERKKRKIRIKEIKSKQAATLICIFSNASILLLVQSDSKVPVHTHTHAVDGVRDCMTLTTAFLQPVVPCCNRKFTVINVCVALQTCRDFLITLYIPHRDEYSKQSGLSVRITVLCDKPLKWLLQVSVHRLAPISWLQWGKSRLIKSVL